MDGGRGDERLKDRVLRTGKDDRKNKNLSSGGDKRELRWKRRSEM